MIKISHLNKNFGSLQALKDVSLSLDKRRSLALLGATAAGKSVFLKCLAGLYPLSSGKIEIDGQLVGVTAERSANMNHRIGTLFQQNALFDSLPVWENISFRLMADGMKRSEAKDKAEEILPKIGLPAETGKLFPADLSGGMQKRVGFARAIITNPDILLLDNPTAGLDPILAARIDRMINRLVHASGATVVSATSNMVGIYEAYDDIAIMDAGILQWNGTSKEAQATDNPWVRQIIEGHREGPIKVLAS